MPATSSKPLFPLGHVVATPGVGDTFLPEFVQQCLQRHLQGDWGDLDAEDKKANDDAVNPDAPSYGNRILSVYVKGDEKLWIITEADRSATCVLLPADY